MENTNAINTSSANEAMDVSREKVDQSLSALLEFVNKLEDEETYDGIKGYVFKFFGKCAEGIVSSHKMIADLTTAIGKMQDHIDIIFDAVQYNRDYLYETKDALWDLFPERYVMDEYTGITHDDQMMILHKLLDKRNLADVIEEVAPDELCGLTPEEADDLVNAQLAYSMEEGHKKMSEYYAKEGNTEDSDRERIEAQVCAAVGKTLEAKYGLDFPDYDEEG